MCLAIVQLQKSSKSPSEIDYSVPARVCIVNTDEKHQRVEVINSQRRSSVSQPPSSCIRAQRRNTMASGGPERASYVSSRGAGYHRFNKTDLYGRDSSEPLISCGESDLGSDVSSTKSEKSATSKICGNGSVVVNH